MHRTKNKMKLFQQNGQKHFEIKYKIKEVEGVFR